MNIVLLDERFCSVQLVCQSCACTMSQWRHDDLASADGQNRAADYACCLGMLPVATLKVSMDLVHKLRLCMKLLKLPVKIAKANKHWPDNVHVTRMLLPWPTMMQCLPAFTAGRIDSCQ
jgi:hypothetical protein